MIDYYINEDKRTVTAVLPLTQLDAIEFYEKAIERANPINKYDILMNVNLRDKYLIKDKYVGIAKCSPEDEFDEEKGMSLAKHRCLSKYYYDRDGAVLRIIRDVSDINMAAINKLQEKLNKAPDVLGTIFPD